MIFSSFFTTFLFFLLFSSFTTLNNILLFLFFTHKSPFFLLLPFLIEKFSLYDSFATHFFFLIFSFTVQLTTLNFFVPIFPLNDFIYFPTPIFHYKGAAGFRGELKKEKEGFLYKYMSRHQANCYRINIECQISVHRHPPQILENVSMKFYSCSLFFFCYFWKM